MPSERADDVKVNVPALPPVPSVAAPSSVPFAKTLTVEPASAVIVMVGVVSLVSSALDVILTAVGAVISTI